MQCISTSRQCQEFASSITSLEANVEYCITARIIIVVRRRAAVHALPRRDRAFRASPPTGLPSIPNHADPSASAHPSTCNRAARQPTCRVPTHASVPRDPTASILLPKPHRMTDAAPRPHDAQAGDRFQCRSRHAPVTQPAGRQPPGSATRIRTLQCENACLSPPHL